MNKGKERSYIEQLKAEGFLERPYGFRKIYEGKEKEKAIQKFKRGAAGREPYGWNRVNIDDEDVVVLEIAFGPGKNTGIGSDDIDKNGLRGHPGLLWNLVMHNGYAGESFHEDPILWKYSDRDGEMRSEYYREGEIFLSVVTEDDGHKRGYWSTVTNTSIDRYVRLLITKKAG